MPAVVYVLAPLASTRRSPIDSHGQKQLTKRLFGSFADWMGRSSTMSEYGFWNLAQQSPEPTALITADGKEISAGSLLAAANRITASSSGANYACTDTTTD